MKQIVYFITLQRYAFYFNLQNNRLVGCEVHKNRILVKGPVIS